MRLLELATSTSRRASAGASSQAIDGLEGGGAGGERDWFFFVNGVEAEVGAAEYELSPGDRVQWDHRDWGAAMRVPAIVGAFPEPFLQRARGRAPAGAGGVRATPGRRLRGGQGRARARGRGQPPAPRSGRRAPSTSSAAGGGALAARADRARRAARSRRGPRRAACSRASRGRPRARAARRERRGGAHRARRRRHRAGRWPCARATTSCVWLVTGARRRGRSPPPCARSTRRAARRVRRGGDRAQVEKLPLEAP